MAALYDPRYDYPDHNKQRFISSFDSPRARSAILSINSLEQAGAPALQTGAYPPEMPIDDFAEPPLTEAQKHARNNIPAVAMYYNENGDLVPAGTASINADQGDIVSNNTAALPTRGETLDNRRSSIMMNQYPARQFPNTMPAEDGALVNNASLLPPEDDLYAFQRNVLNISNALQKTALGQAMTDPDILTKLTITHNGVEIPNTRGAGLLDKIGAVYTYFTSNGMDESSASSATLKAVHEAANNGADELPSMQDAQRMMDINNPLGSTGGALTDTNTGNGTGNTVVTKDNGALTSNTASNGNAARRMTGGYTGNARGSDLPDMQIGLNERLMRMGAAGLAAGGQGSLAQMGAMFGASANVNQLNRQAEMEAFGIEEERRQAHADRVAALAASKNKGAGGGDIDSYAARNTLLQLQNAEEILQGFDDFDGVTGPFNWFISGWDSSGFGDAARENVRLKIAKMKVDSTLARTALTKGAISDSEMDIFMSDQPSWTSDEKVWRDWIDSYIAALTTMHTNLSTGQTPYKNGGGGGSTGGGADADTLNAARKIVGG